MSEKIAARFTHTDMSLNADAVEALAWATHPGDVACP